MERKGRKRKWEDDNKLTEVLKEGSPRERDGLQKVLEIPGDKSAPLPFAGLLDALIHDTTGQTPELVSREFESIHLVCRRPRGLEDYLAGACMEFNWSYPSVVS